MSVINLCSKIFRQCHKQLNRQLCVNTHCETKSNVLLNSDAQNIASSTPCNLPIKDNDDKPERYHIPVYLSEAIDCLNPQNDKTYVDMTFGAGGHTEELLRRAPGAKLFVLDRDPTAFHLAQKMAVQHHGMTPLLGRFTDLPRLLNSYGVSPGLVSGFLFDVGASSMQFDRGERGFSISKNGPLDMRMDGDRDSNQISTYDVVNNMDENGLYKILKKYGEEKKAQQIARAIIDTRHSFGPIRTTKQLADTVSSALSGDHRRDKLMRQSHVATKTFQALRIFVNNELNELYNGLEIAHKYLSLGGVCVVITFHSLEDRIVKRHFQCIDMDGKFNATIGDYRRLHHADTVRKVTVKKWNVVQKITSPKETAVRENPRSRSAKLRAALKI